MEKSAICHKITCNYDKSTFNIDIGDVEVECSGNYEEVTVDGYSGSLICPDYNRVCTGSVWCNDPLTCIEKESIGFEYKKIDISENEENEENESEFENEYENDLEKEFEMEFEDEFENEFEDEFENKFEMEFENEFDFKKEDKEEENDKENKDDKYIVNENENENENILDNENENPNINIDDNFGSYLKNKIVEKIIYLLIILF